MSGQSCLAFRWFSPIISKLNILFLGKRWKDYNTSTCGRKIINNSYENTGLQLLDRWRVSSIEFLIAYNLRSKIPFVSISHVEGKAPMIGPIAPSDDSKRTVHFSQPNTSRHDLWIGPQVFHIMFDTIEVTVNTKSTYHRLLYTLHVLSFDDDISLFSISVCLSGLTILSSCKSLLLSLSSIFAHPVRCRNFFWDHFLKELRYQAQLGNQAFWWFVYNFILTSPDWMGTGKGTFLLLAREKTNGKLSINPIFFLFSRERILPYLAALRSNTNLLPLAKIRFLREF